jgi:anti-sigma regulatory factor (Ser/Thr protein kinase)
MAAKASAMAFLRARGDTDGAFEDCALALSELLSNAIRHAHPGPIEVTLEWSGERPLLSVSNAGDAFAMRIERPAVERESGRGLFILAQLLETPRVWGDGGRCTVSVSLPVHKGVATS